MSQLSLDDLYSAFDSAPNEAKAVTVNEQITVEPVAKILLPEEAKKEFIRIFKYTGHHLRRWDVFCDFITLAASELDIARIRTEDNIEKSRKICERYSADDLDNFHKLFCMLVSALEGKFQDFLGSVFMELELGSDDMGQFFTPYCVQSLMAKLVFPDIDDTIKKRGWVELSEPCCGAAGMVIAYVEHMLEAGYNPSEQLFVNCIDIDPIAADMAFIQLSLLGVAAEVITGNTLTMKFNRVRYTPVYYINNWEERIDLRRKVDAMKKIFETLAA